MSNYVDCHDLKNGVVYRFGVNWQNLTHPTYNGATHFILLQNMRKQERSVNHSRRAKIKAAVFCKYRFIGVSEFFVHDSEIIEEKNMNFDSCLSNIQTKIEYLQEIFEALKNNQAA